MYINNLKFKTNYKKKKKLSLFLVHLRLVIVLPMMKTDLGHHQLRPLHSIDTGAHKLGVS